MLGGRGGLAPGARARARVERAEEPPVPEGPARVGCQAAVPGRLAQGQLSYYANVKVGGEGSPNIGRLIEVDSLSP